MRNNLILLLCGFQSTRGANFEALSIKSSFEVSKPKMLIYRIFYVDF
jgi:hypothetical protein